jgi:RHS repeat-associated protein
MNAFRQRAAVRGSRALQRWSRIALAVLALCAPRNGSAQFAPTGNHYGGRPSDTGFVSSSTGGYSASVPLDLPTPRGNLPIPLQLIYGSRGFGAAGLGWDTPLSYVQDETFFAHRRPAPSSDTAPVARERIILSLLGRRMDMVPKGTDWVARQGSTELTLRAVNGAWKVFDGDGRTYNFTQDQKLAGTGLWLLDSIKGPGGTSLTITYDIELPTLPGMPSTATPGLSIDIVHISYDVHPTAGCFKHEISLVYDGLSTTPLSMSVIGQRVLARFHKITEIDVYGRANCSAIAQRLRSYALAYQADPDTGLMRLASVQMSGQQGTPEASTPVPVAAYTYGTATYNPGTGPTLRYQSTPQIIPLPVGPNRAEIAATGRDGAVYSPISSSNASYGTWQSLIDVTGDGRPDLLYNNYGQLYVLRNQPGASGTTTFGVAGVPLTDNVLTNGPFEKRSSDSPRFSTTAVAGNPNVDYVWRQAIDVNGDGRIDIIDAAEEVNHWVVYLNTPDPGPSGVKWVRRSYLITPLYQHFLERNLPVQSGYLPLSRRFTGHDYSVWTCWQYMSGGRWVEDPAGFGTLNCPINPTVQPPPSPQETYVEWEVRDINGDGYPDVVFNSSPVQFVPDAAPNWTPTVWMKAGWKTTRLKPADPANHIDAVLNVRGIFFGDDTFGPAYNPFSAPVTIRANTQCGVGEWVDQFTPYEVQVAYCGFADVNGDGLADRVEGTNVLLGSGIGFDTATMTLPGFLTKQQSGAPLSCVGPNPGPIVFTSQTLAGLRDLTGDGIPDFVNGSQVYVGTGTGFAPPIPITNGVALSTENETCDGYQSNTVGGFFDIDGDGKPDAVYVSNGSLNVYQLLGGTTARTPEAGRIVQVDNGYGAITTINYRSAKEDPYTSHQVPFPEIVVWSVQTTGTQGLGGSLSATGYAYGGLDLYYDSALDIFTTTGYRRTAEFRIFNVLPISGGGILLPPDLANGFVTIVDNYPLAPWASTMTQNQRFGRYLLAGRTSDVTQLGGVFNSDLFQLLTIDVTSDTRRVGATHYDWDTRTYNEPPPPTQNDVCMDMMFPYDFDTSGPDNFGASSYDVCSAHGFVYQLDVDSWRGSAAPPSVSNVETRTTVRTVDDYGRALSVFYQNDLYRSDDDICVDKQYATPSGTDERVLTAPSSLQLSDCTPEHVFSLERWEYDLLPSGSVSTGFVTGHTTDRHATDTSALLGTIRDYDVSYDAQGNPTQVLTVREDGAARTETIDYDQFGLVPVHRAENATNAPTLEVFLTYDPNTLDLLSARDENGTVQSTVFDGFGRPVLAEITPAGGTLGVTAQRTYTGFGVGSTGRSVFTTAFPDPVDPATLSTAVGHSTITYLDELGRAKVSKLLLGADYTGTMVIGDRTYDGLGRVTFEADPYPSTQDPSTAYGTTRFFNNDGSPRVFIRGRGLQAFTTVPDDPTERYPTLFTHTFDSHTESMSVQDAASLTSGTPQNGVVQAGIASATGQVLFRSTWQNGTRLEHEAFSYDRLGQLATMIRYQDAVGGTNPVQWSWQKDSLGQVLGLSEPSNAPQTRKYSNWGELVQVQWTPASPEPTHTLLRTYDALSRLTHAEEQNGGVVDASTLKDFDYDVGRTATPLVDPTFVLGRLAHAAAPTGEMFFSYDAFGRVSARTYTDENATVYVEQHSFHGDGSEATMELDLPDNTFKPERVTYGYDSAGRPRSMLFSDGTSTQTLYQSTTVDPFGRLRQASFANSNYVANYADIGRRLPTDVMVSSSKGTRNVVFNRYDALGREITRTEQTPTGGTLSVSYDALGRLSSSLKTNGPNTVAHWGFSYDPLGNVLALNDVVGTTGATLSYLTTDQDRICRVGFGPGGLGGTTCNVGYDSFGNIAHEPTRTGFRNFSYLNSGKVSSISDSSGATASFRYDAFGALQELDIVNGGDKRSDRLYGDFIASRYQKVGNKKSNFIARQFPGPDVNISRHGPSGPWIFEFADGRGNRFNTDQTGAFVQDLDYQPFGETTSSGAQPGTVSYSPEQWNDGDALTTFGLVRLGARLYDPVIGRFLTRDPLLVPRTAATTNPYAFAMNDPMNRTDPLGLDPDPDPCGGSLCVSKSYGDSDALTFAGLVGFAAGVWDFYHWRDDFIHSPFPSLAQRQAFYQSQSTTVHTLLMQAEDREGTRRFFDHGDSDPDVEFALGLATAPLSAAVHGACDTFACDQEIGGGDTREEIAPGRFMVDDRVPHHFSPEEQAFSVGMGALSRQIGGRLLAVEGRAAGRALATGVGRAAESEGPVIIRISRSRFGAAALHAEEATAARVRRGLPTDYTIARAGADMNRIASGVTGAATRPNLQLDEWPMAMFREGGFRASLRYIDPHSNQSLGAYIGNLLRPHSDGTKVRFIFVPRRGALMHHRPGGGGPPIPRHGALGYDHEHGDREVGIHRVAPAGP